MLQTDSAAAAGPEDPLPQDAVSLEPVTPRFRVTGKVVLQSLLLAIVLAALGRAIFVALEHLAAEGFSWSAVDGGWLALAVAAAAVAIVFPGLYWWWVLRAMHIDAPPAAVASAYYVGNLGKYVPGKAMVLILRAAALRPYGAGVLLVSASVVVETLTTMAVAAACGAAIVWALDVPMWLRWAAAAAALAAVVPTIPPILLPLLRLKVTAPHVLQRLADDYRWPLVFRGWAVSVAAMIAMGVGLLAVLQAMPGDLPAIGSPRLLAICVAAVSLSLVAGFISLLPGGAGVRELVLTLLLAPLVGSSEALVVAILHRLCTIAAELLWAAGAAWRYRRYRSQCGPCGS